MNRDDGSYKTRIHTLLSTYRSYKDECAKTGNATPMEKAAIFDEVRVCTNSDEVDGLLSAFVERCCQLLLFGVNGMIT